jgi:hypothetical protein
VRAIRVPLTMPSCHGNSLSVLGERSPRHSRAVHDIGIHELNSFPYTERFKQRSTEGYTVRTLAMLSMMTQNLRVFRQPLQTNGRKV